MSAHARDPFRSDRRYRRALHLVICAAIVFLVAVAFSTLRFGRSFLLQFFISPFQMFIIVPWAFLIFALIKGYMPSRSRYYKIEWATQPFNYWLSVGFCAFIGAFCFIANLWISWMVLSRPR